MPAGEGAEGGMREVEGGDEDAAEPEAEGQGQCCSQTSRMEHRSCFCAVFTHSSVFPLLQLAHVLRFSPVFQHLHANLISCSTSAGNEFSVQAVRCGVDKEGGRRAVSDPGAGVGVGRERWEGRAKMAHLQGLCS